MIYINEDVKKKISNWNKDTIHILTDFDKTITTGSSYSSWSILSKSDMVPQGYIEERERLYNFYRPIEIDETIDYETKNNLMTKWWNEHINLFIKYRLSEDVVNNASRNLRVMSFREGAKGFLYNMYEKNIPVIIISAGIGNFIEQFLIDNNCNLSNIYIVSNFIKFKDGVAVGVSDNVIHSLNKNEVFMPDNIKEKIKDRPNIILLGDLISDILMVSKEKLKNTLTIGFLDEKEDVNLPIYRKEFDVVCTDNTSYKELTEKINIL